MTLATLSHLSTLADPTRARLLLALDGRELSVGELAVALQLPQSTVSRHLKVLGDDGWVTTRATGTSRFYQKAPELSGRASQLWEVVRDEVATGPGAREDLERIAAVVADRRRRSREYFSSAAGTWDQVRTEMYGRAADQHLALALVDPDATVGDLGCGDGRFTALLAPHVRRVIAVDGSEEMLAAARARLSPLSNVALHRADLEHLPIDSGSLDLAFLSLVLQYLAEPGVAIREAARTLRPGGRLVVMDLAPHDREDFQRAMGHAWSGFREAQVREWLAMAGLTHVTCRLLPADPDARGPGLFVAHGRRPG